MAEAEYYLQVPRRGGSLVGVCSGNELRLVAAVLSSVVKRVLVSEERLNGE